MIANIPTIGIRFDIRKAGGVHHRFTCWKVFWEAMHPDEIGLAALWEGETAATDCGEEQVFCIAVQSLNKTAIGKIRDALSRSEPFSRICASPMFADAGACAAEPLLDACRIDAGGSLFDVAGIDDG